VIGMYCRSYGDDSGDEQHSDCMPSNPSECACECHEWTDQEWEQDLWEQGAEDERP